MPLEQCDCKTEHCEEGFVIWFQNLLNLSYGFCLAAELSVISYFVLQISTFGTFFVVYSLFYLRLASSVMCPLISEKTVN